MAKKPTAKSEAPKVEAKADAKLVRMVRSPNYPEPHTADVHPDMVDDYAAGGWERA